MGLCTAKMNMRCNVLIMLNTNSPDDRSGKGLGSQEKNHRSTGFESQSPALEGESDAGGGELTRERTA